MDSSIEKKIQKIREDLQGKKVLVAFSGGVDSSVATWLAKEFCAKVLAVTVISKTNPPGEIEEAKCIAKELGVDWRTIKINELNNPNFQTNPYNRCYYCKKELMEALRQLAEAERLEFIIDGTNADDLKDFRPGTLALQELSIKSPLAEAGITKKEIRMIAKEYNLSVYDKPSMACLSSRIPYGEPITEKKLEMIFKAEMIIRKLIGVKVVRLRYHGCIARIEVHPDERVKFFDQTVLDQVVNELKKLGFVYITLDLQGYRSGAMNELFQ
ncbi:MAG: ATP-dependent sacrificial sulfur transferase LarE [Promethearchaeota archaeon]